MGKTRSLIFNENPKKLVYLVRLHHFEEKSLYKRTKNFLKSQNKTDAYSISGWCKIVGDKDNDTDHDENPNTRKIIESSKTKTLSPVAENHWRAFLTLILSTYAV